MPPPGFLTHHDQPLQGCLTHHDLTPAGLSHPSRSDPRRTVSPGPKHILLHEGSMHRTPSSESGPPESDFPRCEYSHRVRQNAPMTHSVCFTALASSYSLFLLRYRSGCILQPCSLLFCQMGCNLLIYFCMILVQICDILFFHDIHIYTIQINRN